MAQTGWPMVKNHASGIRLVFPIYDADGDLVSGATSPDSEVSIDEGTFTDITAEATEIASASGMYYLDLIQSEINGDRIATITKSGTGKTAVNVVYTSVSYNIDGIAALIAALNDLSSAEVATELATYDGPTSAEMDTAHALLATVAKQDVIDGIVDDILVDTAVIGALGAGLTDLGGMSVGMKAEVEAEVDDALATYDAPTKAEMDTGHGLLATPAEVATELATYDGPTKAEMDTAHALLATVAALATVDANVDAILLDTGTDGVVLKAAGLDADAAQEIADAILSRDVDQVEATAPVHSMCTAILKAVSRVRDNAGTLEVYRTNGTTIHASQTVTIDAALDPIDELTIAT